jgi:hypothetical protein
MEGCLEPVSYSVAIARADGLKDEVGACVKHAIKALDTIKMPSSGRPSPVHDALRSFGTGAFGHSETR